MIIDYHPQITNVTTEKFIEKLESCGLKVSVMPNQLHELAREIMMVVKRI